MANGKTRVLEKKTIREMTKEASRLKEELESYLDDLRLYSNPEFWKAVEESKEGKVSQWKSIEEYRKRMVK